MVTVCDRSPECPSSMCTSHFVRVYIHILTLEKQSVTVNANEKTCIHKKQTDAHTYTHTQQQIECTQKIITAFCNLVANMHRRERLGLCRGVHLSVHLNVDVAESVDEDVDGQRIP